MTVFPENFAAGYIPDDGASVLVETQSTVLPCANLIKHGRWAFELVLQTQAWRTWRSVW